MTDTLLTASPGESAAATSTAPAAETPKTDTVLGEKSAEQAKAPQSTTQQEAKPSTTASEPAKATTPPAEEISVKLPDGVEADPELLGALKDVAKVSGLKGEQAQKLADAYVAAQKRSEDNARVGWEQQQKAWVESLKSDADFGGQRFDGNVKSAQKAIERFGSPQLRELFNATGLGNHPELVKFAIRVGQALAEDSIAGTQQSNPKGSEETFLRQLYPSMFKE